VIACSLPPLVEMHVYYYDDGLRCLIDDDEHDYNMMLIYFTIMFVYLNCCRFRLHIFIHV
jgi:hypothetical protein